MARDPSGLARRSFLLGAGLGLVGGPAWASDFAYKGWRFNTDAVRGPLSDELVRSLHAQIDLVESLSVKPEIKVFFRGVDVKVDPSTLGFAGAYHSKTSGNKLIAGTHRISLSTKVISPDSPTFLFLLMFAYYDIKITVDWRKTKLAGWFEAAKKSGAFAIGTEMLHSLGEFFAACTAVVLWGRASREPLTREKVREKLPDFYAWITKEFS